MATLGTLWPADPVELGSCGVGGLRRFGKPVRVPAGNALTWDKSAANPLERLVPAGGCDNRPYTRRRRPEGRRRASAAGGGSRPRSSRNQVAGTGSGLF
jgi:hypothetical protein